MFRGYVFKSNLETGKLETDSEFSMLHKMKVNFTNLKGLEAFGGLQVQSDKGLRLIVLKNGERRGVGSLKIGTLPGFLALPQNFDEKEIASLVYAMLLT